MAKILLIEPNRVLAKTYIMALEAAGHQVRHYARGQTAMEAADKTSPDLVIVELQIPRHNGLEFLYEFRSYPEWQDIPVIVLTVVPPHMVEQAAAMSKLRISAYMYKPTTKLRQLLDAVNESTHVGQT